MKIDKQEIENILKQNPFYSPINEKLMKEVNITEHTKSETPYIPIREVSLSIDREGECK